MDQGYSDEKQCEEKPEDSLRHNLKHKTQKDTHQGDPANDYPDDELERFGNYMRRGFSTLNFSKRIEIAVGALGLLFLIVYTVFAGLQWAQIRWTNRLTREALDDNDKTLQATLGKLQGQINATTKLYNEAQKQTVQATIQSKNSGLQAAATQKSADAAKDAASASRQEMEISQRPWLVVKATIVSGLKYDAAGATITLHYSILNVGHNPALATNIWPKFYVENGKKPDPLVERRRYCDKDVPTLTKIGQTVYPGQLFEQNQQFSMTRDDIDDSLRSFGGAANTSKYIPVAIIDCVTYRSNFTENLYSVADSYYLETRDSAGRQVMIPAYTDIPVNSLILLPEGFSPVSAK